MPHLTLELLLLMLLVFLIGCILGCLFRTMFAADTSPATKPAQSSVGETKTAAVDATKPDPKPEAVSKAKPAPEAGSETKPKPEQPASKPADKTAAAPVSTGKPVRPKGLPGARDGKPDKLQMISGVGPKLEKTLHGLGYFHFDQIAAWGKDQVDWVDEHLRYKGRIERDEWIAQAKLLAADDMEQFNKLYGTGGSAKTKSRPKSTTAKPAKKKR